VLLGSTPLSFKVILNLRSVNLKVLSKSLKAEHKRNARGIHCARRGDIRKERGKFILFLFTEIDRHVTKLELVL